MTSPVVYELPITGDLVASFQRYPYPRSGWFDELPRSVGAMPVAVRSARLAAVPCPPGEGLWIGLVHSGGGRPARRVRASALPLGGAGPDPTPLGGAGPLLVPLGGAEPLLVPPAFAAEGVARGDGTWWALAREATARGAPPCRAVELRVLDEGAGAAPPAVHIDLVGADEFQLLTGIEVAPAGEADAYGGWRLP